jgi:hypothetical protein
LSPWVLDWVNSTSDEGIFKQLNFIKMKKELKTKSITIDIYLSVWTQQHFEVPLDYEIKEATTQEAYQKLINDFEGQNVNALEDPDELDLYDFSTSIDFHSLGDELIIYNPNEGVQVKRFETPKSKRGRR